MPNIFLTADSHFGHANVIKHDGRPWTTIEEHDHALIENWNSTVNPDDIIYHVGDFCFKNKKRAADWFLRQLHGKVHLIRGNHDHGLGTQIERMFASVQDALFLKATGKHIYLHHYPCRTWRG